MNRYNKEFERAIKNMNKVAGTEIIKDVELKVIDDYNDFSLGKILKHYPNTIYLNNFFLQDRRRDKIYNVICHELCHSILGNIFEDNTIINSDWELDESPIFCLIVKWFNKNGFRISQNYKVNSKFKCNIEFINKMTNRSFAEILDFIIEFREYIVKKQNDGINISLINKLDITLDRKYKSYKEVRLGMNVVKLGNDFKLEKYREFIEILSN
ncbi:SprT-like domain-containing protein [Clostridium sp.]|uniref:SprT-like domain-containing protein n=1 Tax=Clostridium sp. TaxID=1506 RepID=UPI00262DF121|nr:SprT-like domain-containing protein [Clostridium sp.]